jgi:SAM-dependent methyltransferase
MVHVVRRDLEAAGAGRNKMELVITFILGFFIYSVSRVWWLTSVDSNTYESLIDRELPIRLGRTTTISSPASKAVDATNVQEVVTACTPITQEQTEALKSEIADYEKSRKFQIKILEVQDKRKAAASYVAIEKYLRENVLEAGWSILELGCAAGMMLQMVKRAYEKVGSEHKELVGVELVTGWVTFAQSYFTDIQVFEGDITNFNLPDPYAAKTFDFVMLNDVAEHIQKERYGCFFQKLKEVTHAGSLVYMHTPTPHAQLADEVQYVEKVLPHHYMVIGMALAGFELVTFEHDVDTQCGNLGWELLPRAVRDVGCLMSKWPKYYHVIFRKSPKEVLVLS